jgi:hypothetical protein
VLVGDGVGDGVLVGVDVGVLVGVDVGVLVGVDVGVLVGVDVGECVGVGDDEGVMVGVDVGWAEVPVKYELPSDVSVTNMDCTYSVLPTPPVKLAHLTAHSTVWPGVTPSTLRRPPTVACWRSVPLNGAFTLPTAGETWLALLALPVVSNSSTTADPWKPVGQAVVVDQVGASESAP